MGFLVIGLFSGAAYAMLAMGFVLVYRGSRIFNLAHGEIGAVGLFTAWALAAHVPIWVACIAGVAASASAGALMERMLIRRLLRRTPLAALAATLGAGLTLAYVEAKIFGINIKTLAQPFGAWEIHLGGVTVPSSRVMSLALACVVAAGLGAFMRTTRFGLEVSAATADDMLARTSGIRVHRARAFVWATGGGMAGIAAILIASVETFHPLSVTLVMVRALAAALLGGLTSLSGAFVAGIAIGVLDALVIARTTVAGAADAAILGLLVVVLLVRPQGVRGARAA